MLWRKTNICLAILVVMILIGFVFPFEGYAVPAAPVIHTLSQPDGLTFKARQWGDESSHGWETADGYSVVFDEGLKMWTYAMRGLDGSLVSSSKIVGKDHPNGVPMRIRPVDQARLMSPLMKLQREISGASPTEAPQKVVPPTGVANIPVILINFSDTTTTYTSGDFNTLLFGTGNYSMKDYYQEVSYGAFSVSAGPGGVVGWYAASNTHDYYGANVGSGTVKDAWPGDLVYEAVAAADAAGFNFAPYDQDGDCYVDVVTIIHQGSGEEASGTTTDIWSHRWSLYGAQYWGRSNYSAYTTNDNCTANPSVKVMINDYVIQPETLWGGMQTMGVFAHEYGHAFGLPDLYDTDGSSEGIGDWSLMAGGSWNYVTRSGDRPAHMDAWCKYKLGWVTPTQVSGTLTNEPITQAATAADVYQLGNGSPSSGGEYFLVENRQKAGFDAGLPGAGLLIWHIDESMTTNNSECYPGGPDCSIQHYHVALEQVDNLRELEKNIDRGDTGDPYPGSTNNTSFTGSSSPNSNLYNGNPSNASVTNISASGSTMTATLIILEPNISVSPNSYYFGSVYVGKTSIKTFTISNTGTANLTVGTINLTGTDASEFSILNDACSGQTVAPSGTCRVDVRFSPTSGIPARFSMVEYFKQAMSLLTPGAYKQSKSAILSIPSNDPGTPTLEVLLSGKGYATMMQRILDIQKVWQRSLFPSAGR